MGVTSNLVRFLAAVLLGPCAWGCQDPPSLPALSSRPTLIHVAASAEPATPEPFEGCDYDPTPMLAIMPNQALLDGVPVDLGSLDDVLRNKQGLYRSLGGGPRNDIVVHVAPGVSEKRVAPFLATARGAGFVNVTRMSPAIHQQPKR